MMMKRMSGAGDSRAFQAQLKQNNNIFLPDQSTIQYEGVFNEHNFEFGEKENEKLVNLYTQYAIVDEMSQERRSAYVACLLKGKLDGQPRGDEACDLAIVLDVSGSMSEKLSESSTLIKLDLAKKAVKDLIEKSLRDDDSFGFAKFNTTGTVLQGISQKQNIDMEQFNTVLSELTPGGGTTIPAGLQTAINMFKKYLENQVKNTRIKRIMFFTDMQGMDCQQLNQLIQEAAAFDVHVSVLGIGIDFNTQLTETLVKNDGCNYFCFTKDSEMIETIVTDFHYNFLISAMNMYLKIQSDVFEIDEVYGTPFDKKQLAGQDAVKQFEEEKQIIENDENQQNQDLNCSKWICVSEINSVTPSPIINARYMTGGLILIKLKPKDLNNQNQQFSGQIQLNLTYKDRLKTQSFAQNYIVNIIDNQANNSFYEGESIKKAILLKNYVEKSKKIMSYQEKLISEGFTLEINSFIAQFEKEVSQYQNFKEQMQGVLDQFKSLYEKFYKYKFEQNTEKQ